MIKDQKQIDGYYYDGKTSKTIFKDSDGKTTHVKDPLVLTKEMLTPESKQKLLDDVQPIVEDLRKIGGI